MKLGHKLLMAPLLTAVVAWSAGGVNTLLMGREAASVQRDLQMQQAQFKVLAGARTELGHVQARAYRAVALVSALDEAAIKEMRNDMAQQLDTAEKSLGTAVAGASDDPALQQAAQAARSESAAFLKSIDAAIDLASVDPNTGVAALQQADDAFAKLAKTVAVMVERIETRGSEGVAASQARSDRNSLLLTLLGLLVAAVAVALSWRMQRTVVVDLSRAAQVADAVAGGDLGVEAHSDRPDEVGDLLRSLNRMTGQLGESMRTVRDASQSIHTASAEIASGNLDLSQRTEQAASRLQQTSSSMGQLTATVRQSADHASTAHSLAGTAAQVAVRGGAVVGQVVTTMDEINASSKRIGDIVGVIDSIAFQTNILALNAAVEAARAGEQGRGFAVVASEVRALAQRSAGAAKEIKTLIDASVGRVELGSRLVQDAGSTMTELVESVQRVTTIMGDISSGTIAQSQGIGTVNDAVAELDQMTQQNAALVEQSAAAAESMKDQAVKLADLVNSFRLR